MAVVDETLAGVWERIQAADSAYGSIPTFEEFAGDVTWPGLLWDEEMAALAHARRQVDEQTVARSAERWIREAAVDTGALEGLYSTDRGFTMSVATGYLADSHIRIEKGDDFVRLFESHLLGFEMALDIATARRPITEAWIRELHAALVAGQQTYSVLTSEGIQDQDLVGGEYKRYPNHVQLGDGSVHAYAPVTETPHEIRRLVEETRTNAFEGAHCVLQAAYTHYAIAAIHPFPDGNGRVCRALASAYMLRATSLPLLVYADDKDRYLSALRNADEGRFDVWVNYVTGVHVEVLRRATESLVDESLELADATRRIANTYLSTSGARHDDLDARADQICDRLGLSVQAMFSGLGLPSDVTLEIGRASRELKPPESFRSRLDGYAPTLTVTMTAAAPVQHYASTTVFVLIGLADATTSWRLWAPDDLVLNIAFAEASPQISSALVERLDRYSRRLLALLVPRLAEQAEQVREQRGF
jgi:Fic family protein